MRKSKILIIILVILLIPCAIYELGQWRERLTTPPDADSEEKILLRLANDLNKDHVSSQACDRFAQLVKERSEGRIEIHTYHGGQLGSQAEAVDQIWFGGIDFARISLMSLEEKVPVTDAFAVPYLFEDSDQLWEVLEGSVGEKLGGILEENGYIPMFYEDAGLQSIYSCRPIQTLADLEGLRVRVSDNRVAQATIEALGAVPVSMPWMEVYDALQNGVIDGAADNLVSYFQADHDAVAPFYTRSVHAAVPDIVIASGITISDLSPEDQALIRECGREAGLWQREAWKMAEQEALTAAAASEEISVSTLQDLADWEAAAGECYQKILPPEALELLADIRALLA